VQEVLVAALEELAALEEQQEGLTGEITLRMGLERAKDLHLLQQERGLMRCSRAQRAKNASTSGSPLNRTGRGDTIPGCAV
jgi:hypothetical protein